MLSRGSLGEGGRRAREGSEDGTLLSLEVEEGAKSQGRQEEPLKLAKAGDGFSLELPEETQPC